jgi:hypothetical protein
MARRRTTYLTDAASPDRADEKARIAAQCRLAEILVEHPEEIVFVIAYLTHAALPGVINGIGALVQDRISNPEAGT